MPEVFVVDGVRTAQGRYGGALAGVRPDDLAGLVVRDAVRRAGLDGAAVDEVILGAANQAGEDNRNVARMAVLLAGLPGLTRQQCDEFALRSHQRAIAAVRWRGGARAGQRGGGAQASAHA